MSSWYLEAPDGRRFNWAKEPTFRCPVGRMEELTAPLAAAAEELRVDPAWLLRKLKHSDAGRRRDASERLTDRCGACGAVMERLGFHCWISRPKTKAEINALDRTTRELNRGLFGHDGPGAIAIDRAFYTKTKADAERWARRELELAREAA